MTRMVLYTINECPGCEVVKKWLIGNKIELPTVVLKKKERVWQEKVGENWKPVSGIRGFPTLIVDGENYEGSVKIIEYLRGLNDRN